MNIICSNYAQKSIYEAIKNHNPSQMDVPGSFWIMTDDGCAIAVICASEQEFVGGFALLQSTIVEIHAITPYIYVLIETENDYSNQILSLQELGAFVVTSADVESYISSFIKFISNPKRRQEKVVHPLRRSTRMYTEAEQLLMTIPGFGEKKIASLLQAGPVAWVLAGLSDYSFAEVFNISKKDVDVFRKMCQLEPNQILSVVIKEDE